MVRFVLQFVLGSEERYFYMTLKNPSSRDNITSTLNNYLRSINRYLYFVREKKLLSSFYSEKTVLPIKTIHFKLPIAVKRLSNKFLSDLVSHKA